MDKFIILELIPTATQNGEIIQLSALKIYDYKLIDRFDYRIIDELVPLNDLLELISYDKDKFVYKNSTKEILDDFMNFCVDYKLLIIDNKYTLNYLSNFENEKESIFKYLNMEYNDLIIDQIMTKYNLEPSNYIVDLLYEALIYENKF